MTAIPKFVIIPAFAEKHDNAYLFEDEDWETRTDEDQAAEEEEEMTLQAASLRWQMDVSLESSSETPLFQRRKSMDTPPKSPRRTGKTSRRNGNAPRLSSSRWQ